MKIKQSHNIPDYKDYFEPTSVFAHLTKDEIDILNFETVCQVKNKGSIIYKERSRINGIFYIHKGVVKLYKTGINGREKIIRFAQQGEIIGYRSVLTKECADTTTQVIEDAIVCFINTKLFTNFVNENNNFSRAVLKVSLKELGEANKFIIDMAQKTVRERLAEVLIILKDTFNLDKNKFLNVNLTREELANLVGTATESVIRLLSEFKNDEYIELQGRRIRIINIDVLKKLAKI